MKVYVCICMYVCMYVMHAVKMKVCICIYVCIAIRIVQPRALGRSDAQVVHGVKMKVYMCVYQCIYVCMYVCDEWSQNQGV
jgi:hypothetical protein